MDIYAVSANLGIAGTLYLAINHFNSKARIRDCVLDVICERLHTQG